MSYNPYFDAKPGFGPDDVVALQGALDDSCKALDIPDHAQGDREIIAARVVDLARAGVSERKLLSERIVREARAAI